MSERLLRVGLTGGIGSGKSTIATLLRMLGAAIYTADDRAKRLMTDDPELVQDIRALFGQQVYDQQGRLNRGYLAEQIFGHEKPESHESCESCESRESTVLREQLNALVHPAVARDFERWVRELEQLPQGDLGRPAYVVEEAAVLLESGGAEHVDVVAVVAAAQAVRLCRVVRRDGLRPEAARARVASQLGDAERLAAADYLLVADDREPLIPQVVALHEELTRLATLL